MKSEKPFSSPTEKPPFLTFVGVVNSLSELSQHNERHSRRKQQTCRHKYHLVYQQRRKSAD